MRKQLLQTALFVVLIGLATEARAQNNEYHSGMKWPEPAIVTPGVTNADPPSDAIVLFDGKDLSAWENGEQWIVKDGVATVKDTNIRTKQKFGDCQLHVEWSAPVPAKGKSQWRGNSGIFLMEVYEIQVLDSYESKTYFDGQAGSLYKQVPPMVNAMRPPGEWNGYDIIWNAPRFQENGELKKPAYVTVIHNGVLIQNHYELKGPTRYDVPPKYVRHEAKLPIVLQNHGNPVRYRNIWLREIKPIVGEQAEPPYLHSHVTGKDTPVKE
ncbi:MAG: DUF1080 domain-containing protein [Pirellulales bacterium]|nr:DUF1080 domain-containing protein [Pirellulales bacterium]